MIRQHLVSEYTRMELHFKNLQVKKNTTYVLEFDILGGETDVYILPKSVNPGDGGLFHAPFTKTWTHTQFTFTTTDNERDLLSFSDWGICFIKTIIEDRPHNGVYSGSYIDHVKLYPKSEPHHLLIDGGEFEADKADPVYDRHWRPSFFKGQGMSLHVDIVPDPLNSQNRCLYLPRAIKNLSPSFSLPFAPCAFGWWKHLTCPAEQIDYYGQSYHTFVLSKKGQIDCRVKGNEHTVTNDMLLYLSPHTPYYFTCHTGNDTEYYWLTVTDTEEFRNVLQKIGITGPEPIALHDISTLTALIDAMLFLSTNTQTYAYAVCGYGLAWIGELERQVQSDNQTRAHSVLIENIAAQIRYYPTNVNHRSNAILAASCGLSQNYFIRLFKEIIGMSPQQYRTQILINRACILLQDPSLSVKQIAFELGFDDPLYFSRVFRLEKGISPREYRKQWQSQWGK